jgi:hypothetical protein
VKYLRQGIYKQGCHKVPSCPHTLYRLYIIDTSQTPGVYLGFSADDACIYAIDRKECFVFRKLQRVLSATGTWCELWNIKINEHKTQFIYFSRRLRPPEVHFTLYGRNVLFVYHVKYLGVIFEKRIYMETAYIND